MAARGQIQAVNYSALLGVMAIFWPLGVLLIFPTTQALSYSPHPHMRISAERAKELRVRACTHQVKPFILDTMLTSKSPASLAKDRRKTTYLRSSVEVTVREVGSSISCRITYMGYGGEYRVSPDLGYYLHCQKSLHHYINEVITEGMGARQGGSAMPEWNITDANCPIQSLSTSYQDLASCELAEGKWYELAFFSNILYETLDGENRSYRPFSSNHSTIFVFKTEPYVERNGSELYWLQQVMDVGVSVPNECSDTNVRYLIRVDDSWPLKINAFIDYQVRENAYVKFLQHLGNGTIERWYTGTFPVWKSPSGDARTHELCVQVVWPGSRNKFRLCRSFNAERPHCSAHSSSWFTFPSPSLSPPNQRAPTESLMNFLTLVLAIVSSTLIPHICRPRSTHYSLLPLLPGN